MKTKVFQFDPFNALAIVFILVPFFAKSQNDTLWKQKPEISFSGFIDAFYCYDFNAPQTNYRQTFFYNYNRHNEFNLNFGFIKANVKHDRYRANLALQAGTYVSDNYASEDPLLKHVYEGNAGFALNRKSNLWLDAGIFASHIGFESAVSKDSWTLTRSLLAENSPYYLSGAKLTSNPNKHWELSALICNGWQKIKRVPGNSLPSFGTQVKYTSEKLIANWSTFISTVDPDSTRRMRYFNNFYIQSQFKGRINLILGFDIGFQQSKKNSVNYYNWFSPVLIARYKATEKWFIGARAEYYQDEKSIIIVTTSPQGFKTTGFSLNIDYVPVQNLSCRIEGRWLYNEQPIFQTKSFITNQNSFVTGSIAVSF